MSTVNYKDKWFYYKLISATLILCGLLVIYLYHMISETWIGNLNYPFSIVLFQGQFFSYFTYQSNIIIGVWFLIAAIYHGKHDKLVNSQSIRLAITGYISVTCFAYILVLFPAALAAGKTITARGAITGLYFHLFTPFLMIFYTLTNIDKKQWSHKVSVGKGLLIYLIFPWVYTFFIVFRIVLFNFDSLLKDVPFKIVYPYAPILGEITTSEFLHGRIRFLMIMILFLVIVMILFILFYLAYFYLLKSISLKSAHKKSEKA